MADMKKLINDISGVVPDMLDGLAALNPGLSLLQSSTIIVRADAEGAAARGEVALISGGGSGHEPAHGGYVGPGMLSAAATGRWSMRCIRPPLHCKARLRNQAVSIRTKH
jgi:dihydroxyacetone kinase